MTLIYDAVVVGACDGAGIGGAALASIEGTLAGICAAHYLGAVSDAEHARQYRPMAAHLARKAFRQRVGQAVRTEASITDAGDRRYPYLPLRACASS